MNKDEFSIYIGDESLSLVDAMARIDKNAKGILFITNTDGILTGCLTDGDVRRWILTKGDVKSSVFNAMNHNPHFIYLDEKQDAVSVMQRESITAIPIVNSEKKIENIVVLSDTTVSKFKKNREKLLKSPVIIMAGGKGTRLYPYTKILPKPLIPIGDTPIVERIIDCFTKYGIDKFYMTVNYKKSMIKSYFDDLNPSYFIQYIEEDKPLGTGGSIKLIKDTFNKPIFVTNCDTLILADYADIYDYHLKSGNIITMVSSLKNIIVPYGVLHSGENGELISMEEKPKLSYFINTGMYVVNPEAIKLIPDDIMFHMTDLVEVVMKAGGKVGAYPISEDSFLDMGEFNEMQRMEDKLSIVKNRHE